MEQATSYRFKPLGNYIHIHLLVEDEKVTKGGVVLPNQAIERPCLAQVIGVGDGLCTLNGDSIPPRVKKGDLIIINRHSPAEYELPNQNKIHVVSEADVIGILEEITEE